MRINKVASHAECRPGDSQPQDDVGARQSLDQCDRPARIGHPQVTMAPSRESRLAGVPDAVPISVGLFGVRGP